MNKHRPAHPMHTSFLRIARAAIPALIIPLLPPALTPAAAAAAVPAAQQESVTLTPEPGISIRLCAETVPAAERSHAPGICVWQGQLRQPTMTNPPEKVLTAATITLGAQCIALDVSGLATPWISPEEMTNAHCRLRRHTLGEDEQMPYYELDICFFKGGAMDYIVTWLIYDGCSMRTRIEFMGDDYPDWFAADTDENDE